MEFSREQRSAMSLFCTYVNAALAHEELADVEVKDEDTFFSYSGNGMGVQMTVGQVKQLMSALGTIICGDNSSFAPVHYVYEFDNNVRLKLVGTKESTKAEAMKFCELNGCHIRHVYPF